MERTEALSPTPRGTRLWAVMLLPLLAWIVAVDPEPGAQRRRKKGAEPPKVERFNGTLEEARKAARERNVPVAIFAILDGEKDNEAYADLLLHDKGIQAALEGVLVVLTCEGQHSRKKITEKGEDGKDVEREVCSRYETEYCADHQRMWFEFYQNFQEEDGDLYLPQTVVLMPDGKIGYRDGHSAGENPRHHPEVPDLIANLEAAKKKAGPGLTSEQLLEVKALVGEGRTMMRAKAFGDAWRAWNGVRAIQEQGAFGDEAAEQMPLAEKGMREDLEKVTPDLVPGKAAAAYRKLAELRREFQGTPAESDVKKAMTKAEKDDAVEEEVAAVKVEIEAEDLLIEARALLAEGKDRQAKRVLKKLQSRKYRETQAAAEAREAGL